MKRYSSIDFLRGLAIVLMIILHTISDTLDIDTLTSDLSALPIIQILLLLVLPFFGGLAGFFLMVSAIGNVISMQRNLEKGMDAKTLIFRQVLGGFLLLIFAMLSEAIIGYHGTLGEVFLHLNDLSQGHYDQWAWRFLHFETVNTIAWCIILNGLVHAIMTRNGKWKNVTKLMRNYLLLIVIVLALTPLIWWLADKILPGYPYATDPETGKSLLYGYIGKSSFLDIVLRFFLGPLAASWEPVFPYLAASFIGSIIGIYINQDPKEIKTHWLKKFLLVGLIMFIVGGIGVITNIVLVMMNEGLDSTLNLYLLISEHRYWTVANGVPILGWLFQFLFLNGFTICGILLLIRLVEFRGKGQKFAEKTKFIRRMGFIAFTIYTAQWVYNFFYFVVSSINGAPYQRFFWNGTLITLALTFIAFYIITVLWEKVGYIGSLEWMIASIALLVIPGKKSAELKKKWPKDVLNVENAFYDAEWLDIIPSEKINPKALPDSRLSSKISALGFLFFPGSFIGLTIAINSEKREGRNKWNRRGKIFGILGVVFFFTWVSLLSFLKLSTFGISL